VAESGTRAARHPTEAMGAAEAHAAYLAAGWPVVQDAGGVSLQLGHGWCALVTADRAGETRRGELERAHGPIPKAASIGGLDAMRVELFRCTGATLLSAADLGGAVPGLSVWGAGATVVLPPSAHRGTVRLRWRVAPSEDLATRSVPMLPAWLERMARDPIQAERAAVAAREPTGEKPLTDVGNAERLALRHGADIRWCDAWGAWLTWTGARWERDQRGEVTRRAVDTVRFLGEEAAREQHEGRRREVLKWALASESKGRIEAMISLCRAQPGIAVTPEELDRDPWLLPVENGVLDLRTLALRPARREDLVTKVAPVAWDPRATAPRWGAFLAEVQPDPEVRAFLQRWAGYAATGVVREHAFVIHHGGGRNGKGVFMDTLLDVLGPYAKQVPADLLIQKQGQVHPTERMVLKSLRLAAASETDKGARLSTALVKLLTGGDTISARGMGENFTEFKPTHKLALSTNNRPVIHEQTAAIWERVTLVPWSVWISPEKRDPALKEKLATELSGILRWIVDGCAAWQAGGLRPPTAVADATEGYRAESDPIGDFLVTCCAQAPLPGKDTARALAKPLYASFKAYCEDSGRDPVSQKVFGERLTALGFERRPYGGVTSYVGLRLVEPSERRVQALGHGEDGGDGDL
jgi:putative DNA primase/helicase